MAAGRASAKSAPGLLGNRPGGSDRVELVRVVERGGLGRPRRASVVVARDRVQQLCPHLRFERRGAGLDESQAEVDVTEEATLLGLAKGRPGGELGGASDVVQQRSCQQQGGAQARVELSRLAADRRDGDAVLE